MRKLSIPIILLAFFMLFASCGDSKSKEEIIDNGIQDNSPDDGNVQDGQDAEDGSSDQTDVNDGSENSSGASDKNVMLEISSDGKIIVSVLIENAANKDVSVVVLKDKADADLWQSSPEKVLAIGQLTLDNEGKGSISLPISESTSGAVLVSYEGGKELVTWQ